VERTLKMGASNYRLLKLLCRRLFDASTYKNLIRIGSGAYGQVYRASLESEKVPSTLHFFSCWYANNSHLNCNLQLDGGGGEEDDGPQVDA
jgi:hypothetical protein